MEAQKAAAAAQKDERKAANLERKADRLREQLAKIESTIKRKREPADEGDEMRASDSSDDEPEIITSKALASTKPTPQQQQAAQKKADITKQCKYYSTGGTCGKKNKCRFVHDDEIRNAAIKDRQANEGRLTIQQRLILNDKEQEDLAVLESIHYLQQKGILQKDRSKEPDTSSTGSTSKVPETGAAVPPKTRLLPAAPASLPPPPPKREPMSNKNVRRSDSTNGTSNGAVHNSSNNTSHSTNQGAPQQQSWLAAPYATSSRGAESDNLP